MRPEYTGRRKDDDPGFRYTFYGRFIPAVDKTYRGTILNSLILLKTTQKSKWQNDPLYSSGESYICPGKDYESPHLVVNAGSTVLTLDHHPVSVAAHWNKIGRKSDQAERLQFYNNINYLNGMCLRCNSAKGGEDLNPAVEDTFRGPGEK